MTDPARHRLPPGPTAIVTCLLILPAAALLAVFTYAKSAPSLWGIPFFYWYQLAWVVLGSACAAAAHFVIQRARDGSRR
jgi:hypothetical protein